MMYCAVASLLSEYPGAIARATNVSEVDTVMAPV